MPYVASNGAMLGLVKSFARELGKNGINVNGISPGAVMSVPSGSCLKIDARRTTSGFSNTNA
ncbi:NAD(P)-dependent dehydrogenase (short-subunit alcohol dehydrogenase family) [Rhizobium sp. BK456]|nr:NAD(P)-dependent dehydrogenase (short-subunit alcohol dehydrogenase family) [Rhizobium sp. BK456]